jgi:hypothetical protein
MPTHSTVGDVARICQITPQLVRKLLSAGTLRMTPYVDGSGRTRYGIPAREIAALRAWLAEQTRRSEHLAAAVAELPGNHRRAGHQGPADARKAGDR